MAKANIDGLYVGSLRIKISYIKRSSGAVRTACDIQIEDRRGIYIAFQNALIIFFSNKTEKNLGFTSKSLKGRLP